LGSRRGKPYEEATDDRLEPTRDPTIAAISAGLVLLAIVALVIGDRLVSLRKLADFQNWVRLP
jgi:hypothetical protein